MNARERSDEFLKIVRSHMKPELEGKDYTACFNHVMKLRPDLLGGTQTTAMSANGFDPNQPRDEDGKWIDTGASSGGMKTKPIVSGNIKAETKKQIVDEANAIIQQDKTYSDFGFRMLPDDSDDVKVGEKIGNSFRWEDGDNSGDELDGVSTIGIKGDAGNAMKNFSPSIGGYYGRKVVLVRGIDSGSGQDAGEKLLKDAEIVAVWDVGE